MVDRISAEAGALVAGAQAAVEAKQEITQRVNAVRVRLLSVTTR